MARRLGVYIFNGAEVIDWAGPIGVFAVARRLEPELEAFLIGDSLAPVMATGNLSVNPKYSLDQRPDLDAFLIPGGIGTRAEMHNGRLLDYVKTLPAKTLLTSVCTGSWVYGMAGLLDGLAATNRKNGDPSEKLIPLDRLAQIAPRAIIDRHRIVDTGRVITAGGISSGLEMGFYLLERFGFAEEFVNTVAHIMEYEAQWQLMKADRLVIRG